MIVHLAKAPLPRLLAVCVIDWFSHCALVIHTRTFIHIHICATGAALTMYLKISLFAHWIHSFRFTSCFITHMAHRAIRNIEMLTGFCTGSECHPRRYLGGILLTFSSLWYVCC